MFRIGGGDGRDDVRADLFIVPPGKFAPTHFTLRGLLEGGDDDDRLMLRRRGRSGPRFAEKLLVDGGPDADRCKTSSGVHAINCEG